MIDNYHLPRENASFHIVIWHGHMWGVRFQMAVIGVARLPAGLAGIFQAKKCGDPGATGNRRPIDCVLSCPSFSSVSFSPFVLNSLFPLREQ